jgi:hypothetical protein
VGITRLRVAIQVFQLYRMEFFLKGKADETIIRIDLNHYKHRGFSLGRGLS